MISGRQNDGAPVLPRSGRSPTRVAGPLVVRRLLVTSASKRTLTIGRYCLGLSDTCPSHATHARMPLEVCVRNDDAPNRAEALMLYGDWLARHDGRPNEALRLWSALIQMPSTHASLKDELAKRLIGMEQSGELEPAERVDFGLTVEQALATARQRRPQTANAR